MCFFIEICNKKEENSHSHSFLTAIEEQRANFKYCVIYSIRLVSFVICSIREIRACPFIL